MGQYSVLCVLYFLKSVILCNLLAESGEAYFCTKLRMVFTFLKCCLEKEDGTTDTLSDLQSLKYLPSGYI